MDPISFVASLTALIGVVATTSKAIHNFHRKFQGTPEDVKRLLEQLKTFESLLTELKKQLQVHRNNSVSQEALQVLGSSITQMEEDIQSLNDVLSKLRPLLRKKFLGSKIFLPFREMLNEKEIAKFQGRIQTHCAMLTNIQIMVSDRKLDHISQSIDRVGAESKNSSQIVSSQLLQSTDQLKTENRAGFDSLSSQITSTESSNKTRHQAVLGHLVNYRQKDDLGLQKLDRISQDQLKTVDVTEAGFQAVHSSFANMVSSNQGEHAATQAILNQFRGQLQQILRSCVTFALAGEKTNSSSACFRKSNIISKETVVFRKWHRYSFPIGTLKLDLSQTQQSTRTRRSTAKNSTAFKTRVTFVPPWWFSSFIFECAMTFNHCQANDHWRHSMSFKFPVINRNATFIKAVHEANVEGVIKSFQERIARPTDLVLDSLGIVHWSKQIGIKRARIVFDDFSKADEEISTNLALYKLMIEEGLQEECEHLLFTLCFRSPLMREKDRLQRIWHTCIDSGGKFFAGNEVLSALTFFDINSSMSIEWIPGLLFPLSELWMVEDLSSLEICLIGTLAGVDMEFQGRLKEYLMCCRSRFLAGRTFSADSLFEFTFGTVSVIDHFQNLRDHEKTNFLRLLCKTKSFSTAARSFLDILTDSRIIKQDGWILLGTAVMAGNIDMVHPLLDAGANAVSALARIFGPGCPDIADEPLLWLLVDKAKPGFLEDVLLKDVLLEDDLDPVGSVLRNRLGKIIPSFIINIIGALLARNIYVIGKLSKRPCNPYPFTVNYIFLAINGDRPDILDLLLQHGGQADIKIADVCDFTYSEEDELKDRSWLTFSVTMGHTECANVLIKHGANATALDGAGMSAIDLAKSYVDDPHPRTIYSYFWSGQSDLVSAEQDIKTLELLKRALHLEEEDLEGFERNDILSYEIDKCNKSLTFPTKATSTSRAALQEWLCYILTPHQIKLLRSSIEDFKWNSRRLWNASFYETLLIRFFYVISYFMVFAMEIMAIIRGQKRFSVPSRSHLSMGAVLLLALIGGLSFLGQSSS